MTDDGTMAVSEGIGCSSGGDASTCVYQLADDESPSEGVVFAVSAVVGRPPEALDPLYDTVDPDALDALLSRSQDGERRIRATFPFAGLAVTVDGPDRVEVER